MSSKSFITILNFKFGILEARRLLGNCLHFVPYKYNFFFFFTKLQVLIEFNSFQMKKKITIILRKSRETFFLTKILIIKNTIK